MMESFLKRIENNRKAHARWIALVLCLSILVSLGTFAGFHKNAIAKVYTREVLDCPYAHEGAEPIAHVHNDDCYDGETLVCTLPELEAHTHDESCYREIRTPICGLEESEGHQHTGECFDEDGVLTCTIEAGESAHVHSDACFETEFVLTCIEPELPVHVHDAGCFHTEEITVDEPEEATEPEQAGNTEPEMPASDPNEENTDTDGETTDTAGAAVPAISVPAQSWERTAGDIKVSVEAPEGAFPENTRIAVTPVNGSSLMDTVSDAVNGAVLEVQAVDITFFNEEGQEIEPAIPIRVSMTPAETEYAEEKANVVHVDIAQQTAELIEQAEGTETDNTEVVFDAEAFTIYAIVYTVDFEYEVNGKVFTASMPGAEDIPLDEIVKGLSIVDEEELETFLSKIASVTSTNEEVAVVTEDRSVRVLKDGDAKIVITMQDSAKFEIDVSADGETEISDENNVAIVSTVNDLYLPANSEVKAEILTEEQSGNAVAAVRTAAENDGSGAATYQAFSIALENVDVSAYDGFNVAITLPEDAVVGRDFQLYQVREDGTATDLTESLTVTSEQNEDGLQKISGISFTTEDFADFVLSYSIETYYTTVSGDRYKITLNYSQKAGIPEGAELNVREILPEDEDYNAYVANTEKALGMEEDSAGYIRLFDIKIVNPNDPSVKYQPAEGTSVYVKIELADSESDTLNVVHFADGDDTGSVIDAEADGQTVSFETSGFSVYAVVEGPSAVSIGWHKVTSLDELLTHQEGLYIGHKNGYYFKDTIVESNDGRKGIAKTSPSQTSPTTDAVAYYFESANSEGQYYVYCKDGDTRKYVKNNNNTSLEFGADESDKTAFHVSVDGNGVFTFNNGDYYWNMQGGNTGSRFCSWANAADQNAKMYVWYHDAITGDPYELEGQSYGLLTWNGGKTAKALMASENSGTDDEGNPYQGRLEAKLLTVMSNKSDSNDKLYVPNNTADKITDWTFEWKHDDVYYVIGKDDNGSTKYLSITSDGLSLLESPNDTCFIQVVPGSAGIHKGEIALKSAGTEGKTLTYSGKYAQGFDIGGEAGSEWLYLATSKAEEVLTDYVKVNTATKVSVSDTENVYTGQKVVIYTREWVNDHYEYYAINSKGELVPCAESGNSIEWIGGNMNDMLWQFTEYTYEGTDTPSGYYELQNLYAKSNGDPSYLAPKYSEAGTVSGILSENTVGILLDGRQKKQYYSPIVAWDTPQYMYSGLTVDLDKDDPIIEPCVKADGLDFYFAIMEDLPVDDVIHTVPTVDNNQYGIVMKMYDLKNGKTSDANGQMNAFLGNTTDNGMTTVHTPGLLSTDLVNGYPSAARGSLADLFAAGEATDANHLFIESTYRATGYYEYNSAQNFAKLTPGGDFVVYQELGTNDSTSKKTLKHGQFFPYNSIKPGFFASANGENLYSATGELLPDSDARKHERLYLVEGDTDYYFAMELSASFEQTPSGLDAWGHDIIFEFSGDDDFWLYVDDELVIDLGGIHSAVPGSVNFRTGEVIVNNTPTTLYNLFYDNFKSRGHTDAEALDYVNSKFECNSDGQYVFKDGTAHTMHIFYMERGAGASNLHMKFNLAAVKKGTVQLSKELGGVDNSESSYALFPYQIYYTMQDNPNTEEDESAAEIMLRNAFDPNVASSEYSGQFGTPESTDYVFYKDRTQPVTFLPELKIGNAVYCNVFMLKPGETAEINFPVIRDDLSGEEYTVDQYRIVECGIDPAVYDQVTVNGEIIDGEQESSDNRYHNYGIGLATTDARPKVNYVNTPEALQSLELTKELYKKLYGAEQPQKIVLYDEGGSYIGASEADPDLETARNSVFNYRLYFKSPYDDDFSEANQFIYHVKDPAGYYCRWDSSVQTFVRITDSEKYPDGTKDFSVLTEDYIDANGTVVHQDRFWSSFETGTHGSITGIPAYYTIEVRDLVPGTEYRIIERPTETPDGYKFWQYENDEGTQCTDPYDPWDGIDGTIEPNKESEVLVRNYKGHGIRLKKTWEDASTVKDRDPAYFAVYQIDRDSKPVQMVPDSVRQLHYTDKQELYWWYLTLPFADTGLLDYSVFEVRLNGGFTVSEDGVVTVESDDVEPIENGGINTIDATLNGQSEKKPIEYTVTYGIEPNENHEDNALVVLADNAPSKLPPVRFVKHDWNDEPLPRAIFSLKYGENSSAFDSETKTSGSDGLIGHVYLQEDVDYTLTELQAPQGFIGLDTELVVSLRATTSGWTLDVSPEIPTGDPVYYDISEADGVLTLTVKNRPYDLEMLKADSTDHNIKLAGAKFSLYKQQKIGDVQTWDEDHPVYTGLTTDGNGVIPEINKDLPPGTYQLRETAAPDGYVFPADGVRIDFTVTEMGSMILGTHPDEVTFTTTTDERTGKVTYSLMIPNHPKPIMLKKTDENGNDLTGAQFRLEKWDGETVNGQGKRIWSQMEAPLQGYQSIDMTSVSEIELASLPAAYYQLTETAAPAGYVITQDKYYFVMKADRTVKLCNEDGTGEADEIGQAKLSYSDGVYTIIIKNTSGTALPNTGGPGTRLFTLLGSLMTATAGAILTIRVKKRVS